MDNQLLHSTTPTLQEEDYIIQALNAGTQSTEILNCVVISRCNMYVLDNIVKAMENEKHMVYPIFPLDVQKSYTIVKLIIQQIWRKINTIPDSREDSRQI